jgi:hypothetical protein
MKKIMLLSIFIPFVINAAEKQEQSVYKGTLVLENQIPFLFGTGNAFGNKDSLAKLGFKHLKADELLFNVTVRNENDEAEFSRRPHTYPYSIFPGFLPFSMIKDLQEGDQLCVALSGFKWCLTAQKMNFYQELNFEEARKNCLLEALQKGVLYNENDKEFLIAMKIIETIQNSERPMAMLTNQVKTDYKNFLEN